MKKTISILVVVSLVLLVVFLTFGIVRNIVISHNSRPTLSSCLTDFAEEFGQTAFLKKLDLKENRGIREIDISLGEDVIFTTAFKNGVATHLVFSLQHNETNDSKIMFKSKLTILDMSKQTSIGHASDEPMFFEITNDGIKATYRNSVLNQGIGYSAVVTAFQNGVEQEIKDIYVCIADPSHALSNDETLSFIENPIKFHPASRDTILIRLKMHLPSKNVK